MPPTSLHDEIRTARLGLARVEHLSDVGVVHHRQLAAHLADDHPVRVSMPGLDDLHGNSQANGPRVPRLMETTPMPPSPISRSR